MSSSKQPNMDPPEASRIIIQNSPGIKFLDGPPNFKGNSSNFKDVEAKIKFLQVSDNGKRIAWIADGEVCIVEGPEWKRIGTLHHPKAAEICFSPNGNFLAVWDMYIQTKDAAPPNNLSIYDVTERKLLKGFVQKSHEKWQPKWSKDEAIMARMTPSEVCFYEGKDFDNYKQKKAILKLRSFDLSPSSGPYYALFFIPSLKGAPAVLQLFRYPNVKDNSSVVASKSSYKVDSVETFWNSTCTAVLALTTGEVDKTGKSYYGEQMLFFLSSRGDSIRVTFPKEGTIRSVAWCPSGKEFFCVYGHAPARASMFNLKCDPICEFGEGARNLVLLNPQGNLVLLGAMGNISSRFEIFDVKESKLVGKQEFPDITHMEWSPCGQYLLTATCSPRLRVDNGFKVWHYTTTLLHEYECGAGEELYRATFLPSPSAASTPFDITTKRVKGIQPQQKKVAAAGERYIPPSQRLALSSAGKAVDTSKKFLRERDSQYVKEEDEKDKQKQLKKQKKREKQHEARKKKEEEKGMDKDWREEREKAEPKPGVEKKKENSIKRMNNIKKKLESIKTLKAAKENGDQLNNNQLVKIASEDALIKELAELSVT